MRLARHLLFIVAALLPGLLLASSAPGTVDIPAAEPGPESSGAFSRAAALSMAGQYEPALREYDAYLAENGADRLAPVAAFSAASLRQLALNDLEGAVIGFGRVVADYGQSGWSAEAARRRAECLAGLNRWSEAAEGYTQALDLAGRGENVVSTQWTGEVSQAAAEAFDKVGDKPKVIAAYEKVLQGPLPPQSAAVVLSRLAATYETDNQLEQAARAYARLVQEFPFATVFDQAVSKRELIDRYQEVDWPPFLAYTETTKDFAAGNYGAAIPRCEEILRTSTNEPLRRCAEYRRIVAETVLQGDFTRGAHGLDSLLSGLPDPRTMPNAKRQLEYFQMVAGYESQVLETPEDAGALRTLGELYAESRATAKALLTLEKARALDPANSEMQFALGRLYLAAGRVVDAEKAFQSYLESNPEDVNALNLMGYAYLGQGAAEQAIPYFQRYAAAAPDDPNAHDSLGEGYLKAGRLDEALASYTRATEIDSTFSNSYFMLGTIHKERKEPDRAAAAFRRYLDLVPEGEQADQAQEALKELGTD